MGAIAKLVLKQENADCPVRTMENTSESTNERDRKSIQAFKENLIDLSRLAYMMNTDY